MARFLNRLKTSFRKPVTTGEAPSFRHVPDPDFRPARQFLFIVGAGRSGNTLLRRMLMETYRLYIPPETYFLVRLARDYRILRRLRWASLVDLVVGSLAYHPSFAASNSLDFRAFAIDAKSWSKPERCISTLVIRLYQELARAKNLNDGWLGDKTPLNTLYLEKITKIIPRARYVYLIRDGADVVQSYLNARIYSHPKDAAQRWVRSHRSWTRFRTQLRSSQFVEISYEELVRQPTLILDSMATALGLPTRQNPLDVSSLLDDVGQYNHHNNVVFRPDERLIGHGRSQMSAATASQVAPILNTTLEKLGYKRLAGTFGS